MMGIEERPPAERPPEKLLEGGADRLSGAELITILLGTGPAGTDALRLARTLLHKRGNLTDVFAASFPELTTLKGLGPARVARLAATT